MSADIKLGNKNLLIGEGQIAESGIITDYTILNVEKSREFEERASFENLFVNCSRDVKVVPEKNCGLEGNNDFDETEQQQHHYITREEILRNTSLNNNSNNKTNSNNNLNLPQITSNHFGLSVLQNAAATATAASSPPPHSYRHSRAYRHFKNPPQPHMCIRTTTETGEELFINVLSWTRIVIPQEPSDPIPLYGGMRVAPGSPRSPPIVFAVMANPEVLKDSGRHSKDPEERHAMVELMCDFVEAMNPGIKLVRNAVILKDRDISGELKDVWNAVQTQRDREREEQLIQQRQQHQQHFHNLTNATSNGLVTSATTQQLFPKSVIESEASDTLLSSPLHVKKMGMGASTTDNGVANNSNNAQLVGGQDDTTIIITQQQHLESNENTTAFRNEVTNKNLISEDTKQKAVANVNDTNALNVMHNKQNEIIDNKENVLCHKDKQPFKINNANGKNCNSTPAITLTDENIDGSSINVTALPINSTNTSSSTATNSSESYAAFGTASSISTTTVTTPAKKEKLGGFLPNGCIFPRFKNHKHKDKDKEKDKDKDKEKEKESKSGKEKEKNVLLNVLKSSKSKEKKTNATNNHNGQNDANKRSQQLQQQQQQQQHEQKMEKCSNNASTKSCLKQIECELQKLDLTKIDTQTTVN